MGEGVLKDEAEAVRWYRLAADQGNAAAQLNLGRHVRQRRGVSSRTRPKRCAGSVWPPTRVTPLAQFNLGVVYATGEDVSSRTRPKRCAGYRLAAEQGNAACAVQSR